jgi:hypothetical protein
MLNATVTSRLPTGTDTLFIAKLLLLFYGAILGSYWENIAAIGGEAYGSCRESASDSCVQLYG